MVDSSLTFNDYPFLKELGFTECNFGVYRKGEWVGNGPEYVSVNPHNNKPIAKVKMGSLADYESCIEAMEEEKAAWMLTPMPRRGEIVR
jgi:aldehyde dehydrogenase family 7 protein A1